MFTSFITRAKNTGGLSGIEPARESFANSCVTISPSGLFPQQLVDALTVLFSPIDIEIEKRDSAYFTMLFNILAKFTSLALGEG